MLGFLPAVTGGGLLLLSRNADGLVAELFLPVGLFGVVITLGLFSYEIYGIAKCHKLILAGKALELALGLEKAGQFETRPREVLGHLNEPFAAAIIYPAVMAAWTYLAALNVAPSASPIVATVVFSLGCAVTLLYSYVLRKDAQSAASQGRKAAHPVR